MFLRANKSCVSRIKGAMSVVLLSTSILGCQSERILPLDKLQATEVGPTINFRIPDYCPRPGYEYADFWLIGGSFKIENASILTDYDRDGIPNIRDKDESLGLLMTSADTNADGYGDLLVYQAGLDLDSQNALQLCIDPTLDTDKDFLNDCEENNISGTHTEKWDTDGDLIPDGLEIRAGMNPADPSDGDQNTASDGLSNLDKVKMNLPYDQEATDAMKALAPIYEVIPYKLNGNNCFDLKVTNIPKVAVDNGNLLYVYLFEKTVDGKRAMRAFPVVVENLNYRDPWYEYDYFDSASAWAEQ